MARTTSIVVQGILGESASVDVSFAVSVATLLVTENLVGIGLSDATLANIEGYLAAHFQLLTLENGPLAKKTISDASESYHNVYKSGFASTRFGQAAIMLDTSGTLSQMAALAEKPMKQALFTVVGSSGTTTNGLS
jgi:hypothetical protein